MKSYPELWKYVDSQMKKVSESKNLDNFFQLGLASHMSNMGDSICEFRFPKTRRGGVVRLYFTYKNENTIYILAGEIKHDTKPDNNLLDIVKKRAKE